MLRLLDTLHKVTHKKSLPWTILMSVCTHSSNGKIQGKLKMNSTSHMAFKFFKPWSLLELIECLLTIKGRYSTYTCFVGESMEIHWVSTFCNNLLPFMLIKFASFWNSRNFFGLWTNKLCNTPSNYQNKVANIIPKFILQLSKIATAMQSCKPNVH